MAEYFGSQDSAITQCMREINSQDLLGMESGTSFLEEMQDLGSQTLHESKATIVGLAEIEPDH